MPFNTASSLAKLMCWASDSGRSQQASSNTVSHHSKATQVARDLASTHMFSSLLSTYQSPQAGSCCTDSIVSNIIHCSTVSLASSSQPFMTEFAHLLSILQSTQSQPHARRCPTSRLHKENTVHHVTTLGTSGTTLPLQFTMFHPNCQS